LPFLQFQAIGLQRAPWVFCRQRAHPADQTRLPPEGRGEATLHDALRIAWRMVAPERLVAKSGGGLPGEAGARLRPVVGSRDQQGRA
jgi:hypothetical protein